MTNIQTRIEEDFNKAYRANEKISVEVLRLLKAQLLNAEIEKRTRDKNREAKLIEDEAVAVVKRQVKNLEESVVLFHQGGREDLVRQTEAEIEVMKKYLPEELGEEAVRAVAKAKIETLGVSGLSADKAGPQAFGKVMGEVMKELKGKTSGDVVAKVVKELLG